jgi:acyl carrier protein
VLDDGVLAAQSWPRFASVMAPKVLGSWHLHQLAGALDFFVLFSSGASLAGSPGQANHAAANAFEDALAWHRQAAGQPTMSINWGPWAQIGAASQRRLAHGDALRPIDPDDALLALEALMQGDPARTGFALAQAAVLDADWSRLLDAAGEHGAGLFAEVASRHERGDAGAASTTQDATAGRIGVAAASAARVAASLQERLAAAAANRRRVLLRDAVRGLAAQVLGLARAEELDVNEPQRQLGLDSLMAVELRNLLGKAVSQTLPATVTFDHPSVAALSDHLASTVFAELMNAESSARAAEAAAESDAPLPSPPEPSPAGAYAELSEDDIALELMSRLDSLRPGGPR